jgi:hypothetical protein
VPRWRAEWARRLPRVPHVCLSRFPDAAALYGAAAAAIRSIP